MTEAASMPLEESIALAERILADAGWTPNNRTRIWGGRFVAPEICAVGGIPPGGGSVQGVVKLWDAVKPGDAEYGPDTPDEPHEAARWLVDRYGGAVAVEVPLAPEDQKFDVERVDSGEAEHETHGEAGEATQTAADAERSTQGIHGLGELSGGESAGEAESEPVFGGKQHRDEPSVVDADFTDLAIQPEPEELNLGADVYGGFDALEAPDLGEDIVAAEDEYRGGVAYFGDNIHTIRLAKMGRLSQKARELKALLQVGWTIDEFRSLQNLIVRIDRGEAPDDREARDQFMAISERSAAMARVDSYRELREAELEAADRKGVETFDPEHGWP